MISLGGAREVAGSVSGRREEGGGRGGGIGRRRNNPHHVGLLGLGDGVEVDVDDLVEVSRHHLSVRMCKWGRTFVTS